MVSALLRWLALIARRFGHCFLVASVLVYRSGCARVRRASSFTRRPASGAWHDRTSPPTRGERVLTLLTLHCRHGGQRGQDRECLCLRALSQAQGTMCALGNGWHLSKVPSIHWISFLGITRALGARRREWTALSTLRDGGQQSPGP